ncbi:MBL fold metallo-hydrolase [Phyllobacterium zundukense]|uniref:Zn-dependent hydrolase n=1 Tax=Phyllobacterium zundukense TaxID=1867719 RepID=A0A2N9W1D3_9HYPH|nr:MBL fold metallo-hydrolase [Phyllobacterium zundukense]ATU91673.1 Zn-dependent hydrolase [Phyllobacterium zundukense]PIO45551.1 Zn-dependent hydrolase [Phyllobacterium zundukense]
MKLQFLRNATLKLDYAGLTILIDPDFGPKHSRPSFTGRSPNPMTELPITTNEILDGVELVLVSHLHADHFDKVAQDLVPKHLPLICQPGDEEKIRSFGFSNVTPLTDELVVNGILLTRREGNHGSGPVLDKMGQVMGFTIEADGEPSIYWAGDTILYPPVRETIETTQPDIVITHSCGAKWDDILIVMDAEQTVEVCRIAPEKTKIIATHMEALDHATVTRDDLQAFAEPSDIGKHRLIIPDDGEPLHLTAPNA